MKIGLFQYNPVWENKPVNREKISLMLSTGFTDVGLLVFPEMTLTGFSMKAEILAEPLKGESFEFFSEVSRNYGCDILAGIIEKNDGKYFNTLLHINGSELKSYYRKIHPFSYSAEDKHFTRGEKTVISDIRNFSTGLSICYDLRFPELYRHYGKARAELIVVIANWPDSRIEHWRTLLKARAIENQCYVAGVNRVGRDPKLNYTGYSSLFDPTGKEIIGQSGSEKILVAELSKNCVEEVRTKLPFLNDIFLI